MAEITPQVLLAGHTPPARTDADGAQIEYDPSLAALRYQGVLEQRWGLVTPFHKMNAALPDPTVKDAITMARLYVDFAQSMTEKQFKAIPLPAQVKPFLDVFAEVRPYILMLVSSIDYTRPEKLQAQTVHEDHAVFYTSGEGVIPVNISATLYNTPTDPWASYFDLLWQHLFRASKLAKWKLRLRLHFFDRAIYLIPGTAGFGYRSSNQEVTNVSLSGFARQIVRIPPVLQINKEEFRADQMMPFYGEASTGGQPFPPSRTTPEVLSAFQEFESATVKATAGLE